MKNMHERTTDSLLSETTVWHLFILFIVMGRYLKTVVQLIGRDKPAGRSRALSVGSYQMLWPQVLLIDNRACGYAYCPLRRSPCHDSSSHASSLYHQFHQVPIPDSSRFSWPGNRWAPFRRTCPSVVFHLSHFYCLFYSALFCNYLMTGFIRKHFLHTSVPQHEFSCCTRVVCGP